MAGHDGNDVQHDWHCGSRCGTSKVPWGVVAPRVHVNRGAAVNDLSVDHIPRADGVSDCCAVFLLAAAISGIAARYRPIDTGAHLHGAAGDHHDPHRVAGRSDFGEDADRDFRGAYYRFEN